jgi:23S rRNA (cytidine1920-2'-O)/16S rRNA (cytidine1409-2'-O)-methyltransferase
VGQGRPGIEKVRLDALLATRGLAPSRERARGMILAGLVSVDGEVVRQAGRRLDPSAALIVAGPEHAYVSRGGVKLEGALDHFGVDAVERVCVDVGASTGGFTDCLLQRGASLVHAVDVGYGQLAWKLRSDERVRVLERTNMRKMQPRRLDPAPTLAVIDASFISLRLLLEPTLAQMDAPSEVVALVKPQFEVGRERVGRGGVVRDPGLRREAVDSVGEFAESVGMRVLGVVDSTLPGAKKGNVEVFVHLDRCPSRR